MSNRSNHHPRYYRDKEQPRHLTISPGSSVALQTSRSSCLRLTIASSVTLLAFLIATTTLSRSTPHIHAAFLVPHYHQAAGPKSSCFSRTGRSKSSRNREQHELFMSTVEKRNKVSSSTSNRRKKKNQQNQQRRKKVKTYREIKNERRARNGSSSSSTTTGSVSASSVDSDSHSNPNLGQSTHKRGTPHSSTPFSPKVVSSSKNTKPSPSVKVVGTPQSSSQETSSSAPHQHQQQQKQQQPNTTNKNEVHRRIKDMKHIKQTRTTEEQKRSHDRILKAELLLKDFTSASPSLDDYDSDGEVMSSSSSSTSTTTPSPDDATMRNRQSRTDQDEATTTTTTTTVPDSYWYNGNLQEGKGDYVTRWAKGVKVAEPLRKYDPQATEEQLFTKPTKWIVRNVQIGVPLALWAGGVVVDIIAKTEEDNRRNRAKQLLRTISGLGPAIIKGGQALASRSDLMPSEYLEELQKLQDDVPRFDNALAFATVEEELGMAFDDVFELIYKEPIAAASIGQVYKARLKSNSDVVALKIQRPNCEEVIALDLYVLRWWSGVANILTTLLNRDIDVQSIIDDFGELIYRELDYVAEAANAQKFSELYAGLVQDVFVPKVYSELTTSKVLTMEWVDGFRLTDSDNLEKYGLDRKKLVDTLVQCSLRQILENGFFHADPHAGNLLATPDGRLCYLDFGMMSYASGPQRNGFLLAVVHIVNRDWEELVRMYQRLGFIPEGTNLQPIALALEDTLPDALNSEVSELNFKNVVGKLGDIMYTYPFSLPPFYISIIRCLGVLEGLAIQVNPQARIISDAYPYIASRVLTDPQNELQEALRRLALTSDGNIRWSRLESLLEKAKDSQGYDATTAVDQLTNYLISDDGEKLLFDLADQIVEGADTLGAESFTYILEAFKALAINDEVAAVRAFRTLQRIIEARDEEDDGVERIRETLIDALPEPTPKMKQSWRILTLLGARGSNSDPSKLVPIFRKLAQEPRIQRVSTEIAARLGERTLSRTLRAVFGLPPPSFDKGGGAKHTFD